MRGSTRVPPERPVLRLPGTDNPAHLRVARQPQVSIGTANPGRVRITSCVTISGGLTASKGSLVPSMRTRVNLPYQVQPSGAAEYAPAIKSKLVGQNFPDNVCADNAVPMEEKTK